jgi:hypothetical protein
MTTKQVAMEKHVHTIAAKRGWSMCAAVPLNGALGFAFGIWPDMMSMAVNECDVNGRREKFTAYKHFLAGTTPGPRGKSLRRF